MTSERQKAANRANARHSTGPKTREGKAAVRLNACRHGLLARDVVLPAENPDAFDDLWNQIWAHFSPVEPIEKFYVERVIHIIWRLQRVPRAEAQMLYSRIQGAKAEKLVKELHSYEQPLCFPIFVTDEAAHAEASDALDRARYERDQNEVLLGRAIDVDAQNGDALGKLTRHERSLERSLDHALDELRLIQDKRRNRTSSTVFDAIALTPEDTQ